MSKVVIITSSGGGGLLQSAIAIEQEERKRDENVQIIKRDILLDWVKGLGVLSAFFYNWNQRRGKVKVINLLARCNLYADFLLFPFAFFGAFCTFFKNKMDRVYNNQIICFSAILKALRLYNWFFKKSVVLNMVLVDLPTKKYVQFLKGIKNLSRRDKEWVKIITIKPLLEKGEEMGEFWKKHCGISEDKVSYKEYIIRESFKRYQNREREKGDFKINIKASLDESKLIRGCLKRGSASFLESGGGIEFNVGEVDKLFVILLGSQPLPRAIYGYVKSFIEIMKKNMGNKKYYLFIFCGGFRKDKKNLFYKIFNLIENFKGYPKSLSIIPMSFQKDDVISGLFHRSDITITKSGGHTIMELMAVAKGEKWIHSEGRGEEFEELLKGIPFWEAGNACYLREKFGGDIVNPLVLEERMKAVSL
jgi:hypothetical protein